MSGTSTCKCQLVDSIDRSTLASNSPEPSVTRFASNDLYFWGHEGFVVFVHHMVNQNQGTLMPTPISPPNPLTCGVTLLPSRLLSLSAPKPPDQCARHRRFGRCVHAQRPKLSASCGRPSLPWYHTPNEDPKGLKIEQHGAKDPGCSWKAMENRHGQATKPCLSSYLVKVLTIWIKLLQPVPLWKHSGPLVAEFFATVWHLTFESRPAKRIAESHRRSVLHKLAAIHASPEQRFQEATAMPADSSMTRHANLIPRKLLRGVVHKHQPVVALPLHP